MRAIKRKIPLLLLSLATAVLVSASPAPASSVPVSPSQRQQTTFHQEPASYFADKDATADQRVTFEGHKVVSVDVRNSEELENLAAVVEMYNLDPWTSLRLGPVQLRIPPTLSPSSLEHALSLPVTVIHHDVQSLIDSVPLSVATPAAAFAEKEHPSKNMSFFQGYHTWDEIANFMRSLTKAYPDITELISIGQTYEGREILGVRIFRRKKKAEHKGGDDSEEEERAGNKGERGRKHYRKGKAHGHRVYLPEEGVFRELREKIKELLGLNTFEGASFSEDREDGFDDDDKNEEEEDDENEEEDDENEEEDDENEEEDDENEEELQEAEEDEDAGPNRWYDKLRFMRSRKLKSKKGKSHPKEIVLNGGQHAREWISPAVVIYLMHQFATLYDRNRHVTRLVKELEWTFIPVLNVDGYIFSHEHNRMWRKNHQPSSFTCYGIDLNRNWGYKWNNTGASVDPCNEAYMGPQAFAALETRAISDYILNRGHVVSFIDFHSFGQLWMSPFGSDCYEKPKDNEDILELALGATKALQHVHDRKYAVGSVCQINIQASGSSIDWTYVLGGVKYSYGVELRDTGTYGFILPPHEIVPNGQEMLAAMLHLGKFIRKREKKRK